LKIDISSCIVANGVAEIIPHAEEGVMRKLITGLAFASFIAVAGVAIAQSPEEVEGPNPTPGECYTPCAQQYSDATDRIRCIARCCGC